MKWDRAQLILTILLLVVGILTILSGHVIFGGIVTMIAYGIFYLRGHGDFNQRSLYEKQVKADIGLEELYEKIKDMDTPLGKAWMGKHKDFKDGCIFFGPDDFWDCVLISKKGSAFVIKNTMQIDKIERSEENAHRFDGLKDLKEYEATKERFAIYAGFRLISTVMLDHLCDIIRALDANRNAPVPEDLERYRFYYHNSSEGWFKDTEGNEILRVEGQLYPFRSAVYDADGEELAAVIPHALNRREEPAENAGFELTANGERFGEIRRYKDRNGGGFIAETDDGTYNIVLFPACRRGKISCNYRIERDGKLMAVIAGSPKLIFEGEGTYRNDIILSYDDDYLVLYAVIEVFVLTLNSRFLK